MSEPTSSVQFASGSAPIIKKNEAWRADDEYDDDKYAAVVDCTLDVIREMASDYSEYQFTVNDADRYDIWITVANPNSGTSFYLQIESKRDVVWVALSGNERVRHEVHTGAALHDLIQNVIEECISEL